MFILPDEVRQEDVPRKQPHVGQQQRGPHKPLRVHVVAVAPPSGAGAGQVDEPRPRYGKGSANNY